MADALANERVWLGRPLSPKPSLLICLADRAVSLLAILPVIGVPFGACGLLRVYRGYRGAVLKRVLGWSQKLKMAMIDACSIPAGVVYHHPSRDRSVSHNPSNAVSATVLVAEKERSIPVFIQRAFPVEAQRAGVEAPLVMEPEKFRISKPHGYLLVDGPHGCMAQG